jgi:CRISPR/Cas system-associated exonuclease Cas4 (RecB family)
MIKNIWCDKKEQIVDIEECKKCSEINLTCNIIPEYISFFKKQVNAEKNNQLSITKLLHCARRTYFEKVIDYTINVNELYEVFRGSLMHSVLAEYKTSNCLIEQTFTRKYKNIEVAGTIDKYDMKNKILYDYKTIKSVADDRTLRWGNAKLEHQVQLNLYKWLLEDKFEVKHLVLVYIGVDSILKQEIEIRTPDKKIKYKPIQEAFDRLEILSKCWNLSLEEAKENNLIPEAEKGWICKYCRFIKECNEIERR